MRLTSARKSSGLRGFTLIEVILVIALTSILMYAMSEIFMIAARVVANSEAELETRQKARTIFSRLEMDLQSAIVGEKGYFSVSADKLRLVSSAKYNPEGLSGRPDLTIVAYELLGAAASKSLLSKKDLPVYTDEDVDDPLLVRYSLTTVTKAMVRDFELKYPDLPAITERYPQVDENPSGNPQYEDILAGNVQGMQIDVLKDSTLYAFSGLSLGNVDTYWGNTGTENTKMIPTALRISISVSDSQERVKRAFETIIRTRFSRFSLKED